MEKLSSILPSNNRISTVDTMAARPVRAGVEGFGVPTATHERRPTLAASDMLNISRTGQEIAGNRGQTDRAADRATEHMPDRMTDKTFIKQNENQYFANRKAEIAEHDQIRAETHEMAHAFEPEEKMHIADDLTNVPPMKSVSGRNGATSGGASIAAIQGSGHEGILPRAVDRIQSRAGRNSGEPGARLSILA